MAYIQDKWLTFILDINKKTQDNLIKWVSIDPLRHIYSKKENVHYMFESKLSNNYLILYEYNFTGEFIQKAHQNLGVLSIFSNEPDKILTEIIARKRLTILDNNKKSYFDLPNYDAVNDLYETVSLQVTGALDLLNSMDLE